MQVLLQKDIAFVRRMCYPHLFSLSSNPALLGLGAWTVMAGNKGRTCTEKLGPGGLYALMEKTPPIATGRLSLFSTSDLRRGVYGR